ncbi:hypothetical protein [Foetidibacter luteolus]|uniref:hypothetical protein n=1 Tax=Foetidibacter luteolus TaxID=2608880 RepID=UPI00129B30B9|nr:hypothetical protein [Foetidibacter luteolus]
MKTTEANKKPIEANKDNEDTSIVNTNKAGQGNQYPRPGQDDKKYKNQPEFIEPANNRKESGDNAV